MGIIARYEKNQWEVRVDEGKSIPEEEGLVKYLENLNHSVSKDKNKLFVDGGKDDALFSIIQDFYQDREDVFPF